MIYRIGETLVLKEDTELEVGLSGKKVIVPKGSKIIIGPDKMAHYTRDGMIQPLGKDAEIKGYDTDGLANYICGSIINHLPIEDMYESCYDEFEDFANELHDEIEDALEEIGF